MTQPVDLKKIQKTITDELIDNSKQKELEKKDKRKLDREINDVRTVLNSPEGRRFLWRLLEEGALFAESYARGDSHETAFNEGKRYLSRWVFSRILSAKSDAFSQMQREHNSETMISKQQEE